MGHSLGLLIDNIVNLIFRLKICQPYLTKREEIR